MPSLNGQFLNTTENLANLAKAAAPSLIALLNDLSWIFLFFIFYYYCLYKPIWSRLSACRLRLYLKASRHEAAEDVKLLFPPTTAVYEEDRRSPTMMGAAYSSDVIGDGHTSSIWDDAPMYHISRTEALATLDIVLRRSVEFSLSQLSPPWPQTKIKATVRFDRKLRLDHPPLLEHIAVL